MPACEEVLIDLLQRPMRAPRETPQELMAGAPQMWQGNSTAAEGQRIAQAMDALGIQPSLVVDGDGRSSATYRVPREGLVVRFSKDGAGLHMLHVTLEA